MISKIIFTLAISFFFTTGHSQKIASFEANIPAGTSGVDMPVSIDLNDITYLSDTLLSLYEIKGGTRVEIPFQVEQGESRKLYWIITTGDRSSGMYVFELISGKTKQYDQVEATQKNGLLTIHKGDQNFLQYFYKTVYPPEGIDSAYKRSGFIHPLWSPHGQELTRIQPPDHYHHYGIWNPWTHVRFEGDTIDFWNLNAKQGTVRFAEFASIVNGPVFSEFRALHEHVVFKKNGGEKIALNEIQSIRVYPLPGNKNYFIVDFNIQLNCAGENTVELLEYRYAGLGWRTTGEWDNKNSMVLTSEGYTRKDADGSRARWCIVQGEIKNDYAGVEMMSFPTNYNFPEPLRIWPEDQYGRGDMFANFCPTKNMDWTLKPGKNYVLQYRFLVYNDRMDKDKAENAWQYFSKAPEIKITKY